MSTIEELPTRVGTTLTGAGLEEPSGRYVPVQSMRSRRIVRGRPEDPSWVRPMLLLLLLLTAALYTVDLSASGYANSFYSAAVQAATKSWKAFFFGSSDANNLITVDKPPAALWVMDLSARAFGLSSWSILVPQALEGVASVALLFSCVRRIWNPAAGLLAGLFLALTPASTVMFRFNNPDALLVLLLIAGTYATLRAVEDGRTRWLALAGAFVGLAFMTKMLQAFLVVPALTSVYLFAGPVRLRRRIYQLCAAGAALTLSAGWWVAVVQLVPASDRPYIGGSEHNSLLDLIFGYNGLGRLSGSESGSVGFTGSSSSGGGDAGVFRMFNAHFGVYIAWMIPAAVIGLLLSLWWSRKSDRTDLRRAGALACCGWMVVTAGAFSLGQGIIHPYYSIALAPPVAVLSAVGLNGIWRRRAEVAWRWTLAALVATTVATADALLSEAIDWGAEQQALLAIVVALLVACIVLGPGLRRPVRNVSLGVSCLACLGGPLVCTFVAASTPQHSAVPAVGSTKSPTDAAGNWTSWLLGAPTPQPAVTTYLDDGAAGYRWVAAATGSERAASYQLATGRPVMAVGGFNGTDPAPGLRAFQGDVADHEVRFFVDGQPGQWKGGIDAAAIARWVERTFPSSTVAGVRIYDLSSVGGAAR